MLYPNLSINDILNLTESLQTEKSYNYIEQAGIGEKPTLSSGGENLKRYPLKIKLHSNICNVQAAIDTVYNKADKREVIDWFCGETYMGKYVIEKISEDVIQKFSDVIIYAELSIDMLEFDDNITEFQQQTKQNIKLTNVITNKSTFVQKIKAGFKNGLKSAITSAINKPLNISNLSTVGKKLLSDYQSQLTDLVKDSALPKMNELTNAVKNKIGQMNIPSEDIDFLSNFTDEIPNKILNIALRGNYGI